VENSTNAASNKLADRICGDILCRLRGAFIFSIELHSLSQAGAVQCIHPIRSDEYFRILH